MKIMKFGGASLADASKIKRVAKIIEKYSDSDKIVIVVSAMQGVTDKLILIFNNFQEGKVSLSLHQLKDFYDFNLKVLKGLALIEKKHNAALNETKKLLGQMVSILVLEEINKKCALDNFVSFGERLSARFVSFCMDKIGIDAKPVDSSDLIVTDDCFGNAEPKMNKTREKVEDIIYTLIIKNQIPVVTGFFGSTIDGRITTLGRGGSDYSATILANCLKAQEIILWKEVDGLFTGDPKKSKNVRFLSHVSFHKADKMAKNGAKILHPKSLEALSSNNVSVIIKNVFRPEFPGTLINNKIL